MALWLERPYDDGHCDILDLSNERLLLADGHENVHDGVNVAVAPDILILVNDPGGRLPLFNGIECLQVVLSKALCDLAGKGLNLGVEDLDNVG